MQSVDHKLGAVVKVFLKSIIISRMQFLLWVCLYRKAKAIGGKSDSINTPCSLALWRHCCKGGQVCHSLPPALSYATHLLPNGMAHRTRSFFRFFKHCIFYKSSRKNFKPTSSLFKTKIGINLIKQFDLSYKM